MGGNGCSDGNINISIVFDGHRGNLETFNGDRGTHKISADIRKKTLKVVVVITKSSTLLMSTEDIIKDLLAK